MCGELMVDELPSVTIVSMMACALLAACGSSTNTATARHIDVGASGDASIGGSGGAAGSGGAGGATRAGGAGGVSGSGGAGVSNEAGPVPACCQSDTECKGLPGGECVNTICIRRPVDGCLRDTDCPIGEHCAGGQVCACNAFCEFRARAGQCVASITDGGDGGNGADASRDANPSTCLPPPVLPPTSPTCTDLPYNAASDSYILWVPDASASGGGRAVTLATSQSATVGGHTYKNEGYGLVGGGTHGIYGDAVFDVDGVVGALTFHFEGCATPVSADTWEFVAAVTRSGPSCTGCPESITRRYAIHHTGSGSSGRYTFDAEGAAQTCKLGADLLEIVLPG